MMADNKTYLDAFAPKADQPPPEERDRSSLSSTLLEEMYGEDAVPALMEAADGDPSLWPEHQRELAWSLLSGQKSLRDLTRAERNEIDEMALRIHLAPKPVRPTQEKQPRISNEPPPQLLMPDLDRPASPEASPIIVDEEWPDLD